MTATDPFESQPAARGGTVFADRVQRKLRTVGRESATAGGAEKKRLQGRNRPTIGADGQGDDVLGRVHALVFQQAGAVQHRQKVFFHGGKIAVRDGRPRHQYQFDRLGQFMLVLPEAFPQQPPRSAAFDRTADFAARDDAHFRRHALRQAMPVDNETTQRQTLALLPHPHKIPVPAEPHSAAQSPTPGIGRPGSGVWGRGGHEPGQTGVRRLRPSRRRLRRVARPLLVDFRARNPCCRLRRIFDG